MKDVTSIFLLVAEYENLFVHRSTSEFFVFFVYQLVCHRLVCSRLEHNRPSFGNADKPKSKKKLRAACSAASQCTRLQPGGFC
ncbi:protein of unknown function [Pseudomonas mediterranea]